MFRLGSLLGRRTKLILGTFLGFVFLCALGVHGSSWARGSFVWDPDHSNEYFLASPWLSGLPPAEREAWAPWLKAVPAAIRIDEYSQATPWALSQVAHDPPYPVVNSNIGQGQNMLLVPTVPVWHVSSLARPVTWGFLLFGPRVGLAWSWWLQPLGCFVALVLLFDLLVPRARWLSVFGAVWYCGSAYVVCWSMWPAYYTAIGVVATLCGYHALHSGSRPVVLACGVGVGASFAAFVMLLYPPWQIPLGWSFLAMFGALAYRDRLDRTCRVHPWVRLGALALAMMVAGALLAAFASAASEALTAITHSSYPGERRLRGGDCPPWRMFGSLYNVYTIRFATRYLNQSEAAGFFLGAPAVLVAAVSSRTIRANLGVVGWTLLGLTACFVAFGTFGIPDWLAGITLMSNVQGFRAQIAVGLLSIAVCLFGLRTTRDWDWRRPEAWRTGLVVLVVMAAGELAVSMRFQAVTGFFPTPDPLPGPLWVASFLAAVTCGLAGAGFVRTSAVLVVSALAVTSWNFNPISAGFTPPRDTELGRAIAEVVHDDPGTEDGRPSMWLGYGWPAYPNPGTIAQMMGARAIPGVQHHPDLPLWSVIDPEGEHLETYNRYAQVRLVPRPRYDPKVTFELPEYLRLEVRASPLSPAFRRLGARYVLTFGQVPFVGPGLVSVYQSTRKEFAIWRIPEPTPGSR